MGLSLNQLCLFMLQLLLLLARYSFSLDHDRLMTQSRCHDHERAALLLFRDNFIIDYNKPASHDPFAYPKTASWNISVANVDCCSWDGVECDENTGHVIGLDLSSSCLYGSINSNSSLFSLSQLRSLNLADNDLNYSRIPAAISQLSSLVYLNLSASTFSGQIPVQLLQLSNLVSLDLSLNIDPFSGEKLLELKSSSTNLRSLVHNMSSIAELDLSFVNIDSEVPANLANLSSLKSLLMAECGLHGEFPLQIFQLPNLEFLSMRFNRELTGHFPEFHSGSLLKSLRFGATRFSGHLPSSISALVSLNELRIRGSNFSGSIPPSLSNLTKLTFLDLANNSFSGYIPSSLQNLTQLNYLVLCYNSFNGTTLPWIGKLTRLISLDLVKTNLLGQIPSSYANLTQLSTLALARNKLTGPIPGWLMNLTHLTDLYLSENNLSGVLELEMFFKRGNLNILRLSYNNLSLVSHTNSANASISLGELKVLELASCNLSKFPSYLPYQNKLEWLDLSRNNLQESIPNMAWSIGKKALWSNIEFIDLSYNMLQGWLPIPPPTTVVYLVSHNALSGEIPPSICELKSLYALDLSYNNLGGQLPTCLGGNFSSSLTILKLQSNNFQGSIPETCRETSGSIRLLDLSYNQLQGPLPRSLGNCTMLEYIHLGNNLIKDIFPHWLETLPQLKVLILRVNGFYGAITKVSETNCSFPMLRIIDLSHNSFSGGLPSKYLEYWNAMKVEDAPELKYMQENKSFSMQRYMIRRNFGYSVTLTNKGINTMYKKIQELLMAIDLSSNKFQGKIPELFGNLKGLRLLNLSNNNLIGHIPSSLGNLSKLEALDFSNNKLSGEIPHQLAQLNFLSFFNVSHNNLTGPIPLGGQFDTYPSSCFTDNFGLSKRGGNYDALSPPLISTSENAQELESSLLELGWKVVALGYGSGLIPGLVFGHVVITQGVVDWVLDTLGRRRFRRGNRMLCKSYF